MKNKQAFYLRLAVVLGLAAIGGAVVFRERLLLAAGDYLIIQDELLPADVIHVIAGEDYRTQHAINLYKQGYGKVLFFTGGWCEYHHYFHGEHGKALALAAGVPEEAIAFDDSAVTSTYTETEKLKDWIDNSPLPVRTVIVVSDPFHMRRALWTTRQVLGKDVRIVMSPVPMEQTSYQRRWWEDERSQRYVKDEYLKTLYYVARYQLSWGPAQEWLASLDTE